MPHTPRAPDLRHADHDPEAEEVFLGFLVTQIKLTSARVEDFAQGPS